MLIALANGWWLLMLRGIAAVLLGMEACTEPGITLEALARLYGGYALLDGALTLFGATVAFRVDQPWGVLFTDSVVGMTAGLAAFPWPGTTATALLWIIGPRAILTGVAQAITAERLRKCSKADCLPALVATTGVMFGAGVIVARVMRPIDLVLWVSAYTFISGPLLIIFGHWLRAWLKSNNLGDYVPPHASESLAPIGGWTLPWQSRKWS